MKKLTTYLLALVTLVSCAPEQPEFVNFPYWWNFVDAESLPAGSFHPTSISAVDFNGPLPATPSLPGAEEEQRADTTGLTYYASSLTAASVLQSMLGFTQAKKAWQIAGVYTSIDQNGDSITLSGKVVLPEDMQVRNIVLVSHYTIGANYEAPSQCFPFEGILAGHGYAVIVADYIGFGVTSSLPHPYMAGELTATNVLDFYFAVLPYLKAIDMMPMDSAIYLMGYSQGGATTMMVQYLIERDHPELTIRRNFAGAGPYDLSSTYDKWMQDDITGIPCAVPMIIQGMNIADNLNLDYSVFFKPRLLDSYEEIINSKKYTVKQQGELIGVNRLSDIVTEECRDKRTESSFKLYRALMRNSVAHLWWPQSPVYMFHSQDDDTVPFKNSQIAREEWYLSNIEYNFGHYGSHMKGYLTFLHIVNNFLKNPA